MPPRVGVIIPCFNQGCFAAECVASLRAQTYKHWRAVLVDDASTDDSLPQLQALVSDNVRIVHLDRNLGRALVRNEATRYVGDVEYVLNVDCDDTLAPEYVGQLVESLESDRCAGLAYGTLHFFGDSHRTDYATWPSKELEFGRRYLENVIPGPGVLFRAPALFGTRGWRQEFTDSSGEDWDIWLQVVESGWDALWVRNARYHYRQHHASFLARSTTDTQVEVALNMLGVHAEAIRTSCGFDAFLSPVVVPALLDALRRAQGARTRRMLTPLLRHAPLTTIRLLARHYVTRLRAILRR